MLVLTKNNVVKHHNLPFQVSYKYATVLMIQEPLLLIIGFGAFFAVAMFYMRLELTITSNDTPLATSATEAVVTPTSLRSRRDRASGGDVINKLLALQSQLVHAYDHRQTHTTPAVFATIRGYTEELRKLGEQQLTSTAARLDTAQFQLRGAARRYAVATSDTEIDDARAKYVNQLAETLAVLKELALV